MVVVQWSNTSTSCLSHRSPAFDSMLEIDVVSQSTGQKVKAELAWVSCDATSGHFMNHKTRTAEMKEARSSAHNSHTSMKVCVHEKKMNKMNCMYTKMATCMKVPM